MSLRGGEDYNRAHDLQSGDRVGAACSAVRPVFAKNHSFEPLNYIGSLRFSL